MMKLSERKRRKNLRKGIKIYLTMVDSGLLNDMPKFETNMDHHYSQRSDAELEALLTIQIGHFKDGLLEFNHPRILDVAAAFKAISASMLRVIRQRPEMAELVESIDGAMNSQIHA